MSKQVDPFETPKPTAEEILEAFDKERPPTRWNTEVASTDKLVADPKSGALKADGNKNQLDLLPIRAIEQVGLVMTYGALKYDANNWRGGMSYSRLIGATLRHIFAFMRNEKIDPDTNLSHLSHSATNLLFLVEMIETGTGTNDIYKYK